MGGVLSMMRPCVDVQKLKEFKGLRDAKNESNFLWAHGVIFSSCGYCWQTNQGKYCLYALNWCSFVVMACRCDNMRREVVSINTWDVFRRELKQQFYPKCVNDKTRSGLHRLTQHNGGVRVHVRVIRDYTSNHQLGDNEAFFYFMYGLKP